MRLLTLTLPQPLEQRMVSRFVMFVLGGFSVNFISVGRCVRLGSLT